MRIRRLIAPVPGTVRRIPIGPAAGLRMRAEPAQTASADMWAGLFESELAATVRRMARPGTRCVDVGANSGYYTLLFAARTRAPVVAYEPDPVARGRLQANLDLNPWSAPYVDLRSSFVAGRAADGRVTLDEDLGESATIGLLKIDVDGPEVEVLVGAQRLLTVGRPHVIVETHSAELEDACAQLLTRAGYRPRVLTARRVAPQNRAAAHNRWLVAEGRPAPAGRADGG